MRVEPIAPRDVGAMVEMARRAHAECRYRGLRFSPEMVRANFLGMIRDGFAVKCTHGGAATGFFLGFRSLLEFSPDPIGMEVSFYVLPEYRGTRSAALLVGEFLGWCRARGMPAFIKPHFFEDNSKTYRFLEKMGGKEIGRIYVW